LDVFINKEKLNYSNLFQILYDPVLDISSKEEDLDEENLNSSNINNDQV